MSSGVIGTANVNVLKKIIYIGRSLMASTTLSSVQYSGDLVQVLEEVSKELPVGPVFISYPLLFIPRVGN